MSRKRLLIIDGDETFVQEVVGVAERRGFEVLTSTSSVEGLEMATSHAPDLVVVNVELAPTNGWSVCTKLKKDEALSHIPVVLTSANSTADTFEKHRKLRTRAEEYLLKPYSPSDLLEVAGGLLGLPSLAEPLVEVDDTFDDDTFDDAGFDDEGFDDYALDDDSVTVSEPEPVDTIAFDEDDGFGALEDEPDPLAAEADDLDWSSDPLDGPLASDFGDEEIVAFDEEVEPLPEQPREFKALEEFSRGEFATSEFSAGALAMQVDESDPEPLEDDFHVDTSDESWDAEEIDPLGGFNSDPDDEDFVHVEEASDEAFETAELVAFEDDSFEELGALDDSGGDAALDEFAYDEAPLEVPGEAIQELGEEEFVDELGSALDDGDFDLDAVGLDLGGDTLGGEQLARLGELEAQLDGLRAVEVAREAEIAGLREELSHRDQALHDLRLQLEAKERELQQSSAQHETEVSRASAEKVRREATLKSLTSRGEQLVAAVRKSERELTSLRAEAARVPELKSALATATEQVAELEAVRSQLTEAQEQLEAQNALRKAIEDAKAAAEAQLEDLKNESDGLRSDLSETRRTAERALENAGTLQEKLAEANERVQAAELRVGELEKANATARDALLHLVEGLGTA